jgi:ABC-2 type transport system ATP-binding protein
MIIAEQLTKYYGDRAAVSGVSFKIEEGEVIGLLGLNGAGKTTILRILSGLLLPTSGRVVLNGLDMAHSPEEARANIGFLPEQPPLYPEMTADTYLRFVARIKGFRGDLDRAVEDAVNATDLAASRHQPIGTLSNGFQRRVGIAQAVVHQPSLVLLDEPTSGLDPVQIVHMRNLIRGLRGKNTILVSSHNLPEIHQMCDRILVLQKGVIAAEGTEDELAKRVVATTRVTLEVRAAAHALTAALGKVKAVTSHRVQREEGGITEAVVELGSDAREELARALVEAGLGLRRMERVQVELENIFLALTATSTPEVRS